MVAGVRNGKGARFQMRVLRKDAAGRRPARTWKRGVSVLRTSGGDLELTAKEQLKSATEKIENDGPLTR
jgi:hypothetical protein